MEFQELEHWDDQVLKLKEERISKMDSYSEPFMRSATGGHHIDKIEKERVSNGPSDSMNESDDLSHAFDQSNEASDLRLIVEGKPLYVSRVVLSLVSPVLKRLFTSSESEDTVEFPLPGKRYEDVVEFLCCVYPNILKTITDNNVEAMLQLGNEFGVKKLMEKCEDFLVRKLENGNPIPHPEEIINSLCISERYGLETLRKTSFDSAAKTESELLENVHEFWELPNVTTTSVFIRRLKLLENCDKKIRSKINEVSTHCSLYHKGERTTDTLCTKCFACIGKTAVSELKQVM